MAEIAVGTQQPAPKGSRRCCEGKASLLSVGGRAARVSSPSCRPRVPNFAPRPPLPRFIENSTDDQFRLCCLKRAGLELWRRFGGRNRPDRFASVSRFAVDPSDGDDGEVSAIRAEWMAAASR